MGPEKTLCIRHSPAKYAYNFEPYADSIASVFETRGFWDGTPPSDPESYDAIAVFGGMMSANDDLPWIRDELEWIGSAMKAGVPLLGICLGAQMIAKVSGADIVRVPEQELGYMEVALTREGRASPLFEGFADAFTAFEWHNEGFELPKGATPLAERESWRNQAFSLSDTTFALQFHLEFTREHVLSMVDEERERWPRGAFVQPPETIAADAAGSVAIENGMRTLLGNFSGLARALRGRA